MPKVKNAIRVLQALGWEEVRQRGSHRQFQHRDRPGTVTVPGKLSDDLPAGTWRSILRTAGLDKDFDS